MNMFGASSTAGIADENTENRQPQFSPKYPLRILIADDNYINRRVLLLFLRRLGYFPLSVENGAECLKAAIERDYDLILTDIDMPEMDGLECAVALREAGITTPIVAMTADAVGNTQAHCFRAGMTGYLPKPVNLQALQTLLQKVYFKRFAEQVKRGEEVQYHSMGIPRLFI